MDNFVEYSLISRFILLHGLAFLGWFNWFQIDEPSGRAILSVRYTLMAWILRWSIKLLIIQESLIPQTMINTWCAIFRQKKIGTNSLKWKATVKPVVLPILKICPAILTEHFVLPSVQNLSCRFENNIPATILSCHFHKIYPADL